MTWSRFDDLYDEHEKVEEAWEAEPATIGLHVMATTASNRWLSDGVIRPRWLKVKLPNSKLRDRTLGALVNAGLFDVLPAGQVLRAEDTNGNLIEHGPFPEDRYVVHDFLDRHPSSVMVKERRRADSERKARGRQSDSRRSPRGIQKESARPDPTHTHNSTVAASGDDAQRVWEAYISTRHHVLGARSTPQFTKDRRALIARRLKEWPVADLVDAVQGWQHFPHNRGENDRSTPYCDLELVIKDAAHIERFRDKQRGTTAEPLHELAARATAAHAEAAA